MKKLSLIILIFAGSINFCIAQWEQTNGHIGTNVYPLDTMGANIITASDSGLFITGNDGASWTEIDNGLPKHYISWIVTIGTNIFAGTYERGLYQSKDMGTTWDTVDIPNSSSFLYQLAASGTNIVAAAGTGIFLSSDTGATWKSINKGLASDSFNIRALAVSGSNIFAGTYLGGIYLSKDTGASWTAVTNGLRSTQIKFLAASETNIITATDSGVFLSTDTGTTWLPANNGFTDSTHVRSFAFSGSNIYAGNDTDGVFVSYNNGANWKAVNYNLTDKVVLSLAISGTYLFAGTDSTGVWKIPLSALAVDNIGIADNVFSLYPNPATSQLTIHASFLQNEEVIVSVLNVLGQETSPPTPLSRNAAGQAQREENAVIDVSKLSAGIYFLQMKSESGSFTKMFVKE